MHGKVHGCIHVCVFVRVRIHLMDEYFSSRRCSGCRASTHAHILNANKQRNAQIVGLQFRLLRRFLPRLLVTYTGTKATTTTAKTTTATSTTTKATTTTTAGKQGNINECKQQQSILYYQKPKAKKQNVVRSK